MALLVLVRVSCDKCASPWETFDGRTYDDAVAAARRAGWTVHAIVLCPACAQ